MLICENCQKRFHGERSFVQHRTGEFERRRFPKDGPRGGVVTRPNTRRCLTDFELVDAGWRQGVGKVWIHDRGGYGAQNRNPGT